MKKFFLALLVIVALAPFGTELCFSQESAGNRCVQAENPQDRITACTELIDSGQFEAKVRAKIFAFRAMAYATAKEYDKALADYEQAINLDPGPPDTYLNRGVLQNYLKDYAPAKADFDQVIQMGSKAVEEADPGNAEQLTTATATLSNGYYYRALSWQAQQKYDEANRDFEKAIDVNSKAIEKNSENFQAYYDRARAYQAQYRYTQASADYKQAAQLLEAHANSASGQDRARQLKFAEDWREQAVAAGTSAALDEHFGQYLQEIQRDNAYPNWPEPPYDSFRRIHLHEVVPAQPVQNVPTETPSVAPPQVASKPARNPAPWIYASVALAFMAALGIWIIRSRRRNAVLARSSSAAWHE